MRCKLYNSLTDINVIKFLQDLESKVDLYLIGGALRDFLNEKQPRDLDFVYIGNYQVPEKYSYTLNSFQGYKLQFDNINIDLWSIENTYAFKKGFLDYKHPDDFLFTTYLNIDQLMYSFSQEKFLLQCDKYYMQIKEIDAVCVIPELTKYNMVRAFRYSKKYKLPLSKFLKFIFECAKATPQELLELQEKHYHDNYLNKEEIKFFIKSLN